MPPELPSVQDQVASLWGSEDGGDAAIASGCGQGGRVATSRLAGSNPAASTDPPLLRMEQCGCVFDHATGVSIKFCPAHACGNGGAGDVFGPSPLAATRDVVTAAAAARKFCEAMGQPWPPPGHLALDEAGPELDNSGQEELRVGQKIVLRIPGKPQPGGSKRAFVPKGWTRPVITDANPVAVDWKRTVQAFALAKASGRILDGPLRVTMTFVLPRLQGHFGKHGLRPSAPAYPATKPDVLKLARSTEDALTGIVWTDDARIVTEILSKRYTTNGRTGAVIEIEEIV